MVVEARGNAADERDRKHGAVEGGGGTASHYGYRCEREGRWGLLHIGYRVALFSSTLLCVYFMSVLIGGR